MFGAGTDYALLIVSRFRDELRRTDDVEAAIARATARTSPAILASGGIVVASMLVLELADFNATREMGPILALGIIVMVAAGLTLLPALLVGVRAARVLAGGPAAGARPGAGVSRHLAARRRARPAPPAPAGDRQRGDPGRRRARQPRGAGLPDAQRAVPRSARVGPGPAADRRALPARAGRADDGPHAPDAASAHGHRGWPSTRSWPTPTATRSPRTAAGRRSSSS